MDLSLPDVTPTYRRHAASAASERWITSQMRCMNCSAALVLLAPNTRGVDIRCTGCDQRYQVKACADSESTVVPAANYRATVAAHRDHRAHLIVLRYAGDVVAGTARVTDVMVVHHVYIPSAAIIRRPAPIRGRTQYLADYDLSLMPMVGRVHMVFGGRPVRDAADQWLVACRTAASLVRGGWAASVMRVLTGRRDHVFHLRDLYARERHFSRLHPHNSHVRAKIRQIVRFLVAAGLLIARGDGWYARV